MTDELIKEINSFIEELDKTIEDSYDSKNIIDSFIANNYSTSEEINQFIEIMQDLDEEKPKQDLEVFDETQNEISFMLEEPSSFIGDSLKRRNLGNGISIIVGFLKDSTRANLALQSFRFNKKDPYNWTMDKAKDWLKGKKVIEDNKRQDLKNLQYVTIDDVKILHVLKEGTKLRILGVAISEGEWNGIFYPAKELEKGCKSLVGRPLRIDHSSSSRDIVGKVIKSVYVPEKKWIEFEAIVTDEEIAQKLLDKLIDSVSVGVLIDKDEVDGKPVARNLEFKELSLVDDPACKDAKIKPVKN
ncbi:hypothetical protein K9M74_03755 [Candidatus Woesearchaeota archaeon]|nr:hypothetical protein [Candidatus Woesearchaeota archaeon]